MQLSVIILNYNVRYFLEQCILSVKKALAGIEGEIIVVDNNSPDDSCEIVKSRYPEVKLIARKDNAGFAVANNAGVAVAKGMYVCILNPDTVVAEDTFTKLLDFAGNKENMGITGVKMVDGTGCFLPESKRGVPTPWVAITKVLGLYKVFPKTAAFNKYYAQHLDNNTAGEAEILTGAFMFMEREVYREAGGFDENYFMYGEDMDLSYTVLQSGRQNFYYPCTAIIHYKGESTIRDALYMKRFKEANEAFYQKHFKGSVAFDLFMRAGAFFFSFAKKNKKVKPVNPQEYFLFSKDETLKEVLEDKLGKKVIRLSEYKETMLHTEGSDNKKRTEIIFDNVLLSFADIIAIMQRHRHDCYTFKIKPEGCNFIIGSNNSNSRGAVLQW